MIDSGAAAFLQQAQRNNWQQYLESLHQSAPTGWNLCILTASDERQAAMYRRQLDWRRDAGQLPAHTRFWVLADPGGRRIGSGGATLVALREVCGAASGPTSRVLVIHAGGDAQRLPHCSALGKLFARIPRTLPDGRSSTIFDEFLIALSGLAAELPPGVLIASGDVLLVFDALQLRWAFRRGGTIGVATTAAAEVGTQHGVYVRGEAAPHQVRAYLHKPSCAELARWQALGAGDTALIDTGLVWFDRPTAERLADIAARPEVAALLTGTGAAEPMGLNLYGDFLLPLAASTTLSDYLSSSSDGAAASSEPAPAAVQVVRRTLWEQLRGRPFSVECLRPAIFERVGASHEYWRLVAGDPELARLCGWSPAANTTDVVCINASLDPAPDLGAGGPAVERRPALLVDTLLRGPLRAGGAAIVANVETALPIRLAPDLVLHQLPLADGYVTRLFGLHDDPKRRALDAQATYLNQPWAAWLAGDDELSALLWPDLDPAARSLWNAWLFPVAHERDESLALALPLQNPLRAPDGWRDRWLAAPRLSLADGARQADGERILLEMAAIEDQVAARRFYDAVVAEQPARQAATLLGRPPRARGVGRPLVRRGRSDPATARPCRGRRGDG